VHKLMSKCLVQVFCLVKEELAILDEDDPDSVQRQKC
jgi:hypothetical protein